MELIKSDDSENPICPHCEMELKQVVAKQFDVAWFKVSHGKVRLLLPTLQESARGRTVGLDAVMWDRKQAA